VLLPTGLAFGGLVDVAGIELKATLKARKLLSLLNAKSAKNI
jgi:hypothetical protein